MPLSPIQSRAYGSLAFGEDKPSSPWLPIFGVLAIGAVLYMALTDPTFGPEPPYKNNRRRRRRS